MYEIGRAHSDERDKKYLDLFVGCGLRWVLYWKKIKYLYSLHRSCQLIIQAINILHIKLILIILIRRTHWNFVTLKPGQNTE